MKHEKLKSLLRSYFDNTISDADCVELLSYMDKHPHEVERAVDETLPADDTGPKFSEQQAQDVLSRIKADGRFVTVLQPPVIKFYQRRWLQVAAILLVILTAVIVVLNKNNTPANIAENIIQKPIVPGSNKAMLTLANGQTVVLDSASNGVIAGAGNNNVVKKNDGELVYQPGENAANNRIPIYNILTTPKGGEYRVTLSDGTKVWLNAASSLSYPQEFTGNERKVKLTGEAYFEVAKNKSKPFYVMVNDVQVRVLGTHFNISGYTDDGRVTTTLIEGAVQVSKYKVVSSLMPGQKAVVNNSSADIVVSSADVSDAVAWKNGYFTFNEEDITGIMKKVSRWYDVEVVYEGAVSNEKFGGTFYRSKSINELLDYLRRIGNISFKISGRRIIVMK
ncbi:FecR family protein [Mucilaginibacter limnophilus]|uniref:FecR family protein n=1 Tax=Mucilaginibacter limnophilus TaxID=1932778 RepID=A0A3S2V3G4_9SPHI|nr:FecR family protein [Mucilaginibacter limnophilus]RVU02389.1 FecR family protein [Mucilaginibacter limnophilus]